MTTRNKWFLVLVVFALIALTFLLLYNYYTKVVTEVHQKSVESIGVYQKTIIEKRNYNNDISNFPVILLLSELFPSSGGQRNRINSSGIEFSTGLGSDRNYTFEFSCCYSFTGSYSGGVIYSKELVITDTVKRIADMAKFPVFYKEVDNGYIINVSESSKTIPVLTTKSSFPPLVLVSPNLQRSCDFIEKLTGAKISIQAQHPIKVVEHYEQFTVDCHPWRAPWKQVVFQTVTSTTFTELMSSFAEFHGCAAEVNGDSVVIRDQTPDEIKRSLDSYLAGGLVWYHSDSEYSLQPSAASEAVRRLNSSDEIFPRELSVLLALNQKVGRDELIKLLNVSGTGPLYERRKEDIIKNLILLGDDVVIPYIEDRYDFKGALTLLGDLHTPKAVEKQKELISERCSKTLSIFKVGRIDVMQKSAGITENDLRNIIDLAIELINGVLEPSKGEYPSNAVLFISDDGLSAIYKLNSQTFTQEEYQYNVEFSRFQNNWFIKNYQEREEVFKEKGCY